MTKREIRIAFSMLFAIPGIALILLMIYFKLDLKTLLALWSM